MECQAGVNDGSNYVGQLAVAGVNYIGGDRTDDHDNNDLHGGKTVGVNCNKRLRPTHTSELCSSSRESKRSKFCSADNNQTLTSDNLCKKSNRDEQSLHISNNDYSNSGDVKVDDDNERGKAGSQLDKELSTNSDKCERNSLRLISSDSAREERSSQVTIPIANDDSTDKNVLLEDRSDQIMLSDDSAMQMHGQHNTNNIEHTGNAEDIDKWKRISEVRSPISDEKASHQDNYHDNLQIKENRTQIRQRPQISLGHFKMALYLEASKVHCGHGVERMFANYWDTLEKYIASFPAAKGRIMRRERSDVRVGTPSIESTSRSFLLTRKMKRLHNKIVLAIMAEAMSTQIPACCSSHMPQHYWGQTQRIQSTSDKQLNEGEVLAMAIQRDRNLDISQWNTNFGPQSGTWTVCENEITLGQTDSSNSIQPSLAGSTRIGDLVDDEIVPSARLPGVLEVEPFVRKLTSNSGLAVSDDSLWMLVVAVRENSSSLINKMIANDKVFDEGCAPELPAHYRTSLACHPVLENNSEILIQDNSGGVSDKMRKSERRVINSTSLLHVLDENISASSRLASNYCDMTFKDGQHSSQQPDIDTVNCIINTCIQRSANRRQKYSPSECQRVSITAAKLQPTGAQDRGVSVKTEITQTMSTNDPHPKEPIVAHLPSPSTLPAQCQEGSLANAEDRQIKVQLPLQYNQPLAHPAPHQTGPISQQPLHDQTAVQAAALQQPIQQSRPPAKGSGITMLTTNKPLTKPGFPGLMSSSAPKETVEVSPPSPPKVTPPESSSSNSIPKEEQASKTSNPASRAGRRGSKDIAALTKVKPQPQYDGDDKGENTVSTKDNEKDNADNDREGDTGTKDSEGASRPSSKSPPSCPSSRGRGFGTKNLAAMRARASFSSESAEK